MNDTRTGKIRRPRPLKRTPHAGRIADEVARRRARLEAVARREVTR